ncbi:hypothetical protein PISMIDRAFT_675327 [Pisolithus microcarpus 441]|uniref:Uncharacterized protein n=1 Tax=Pisolithus microcarpus 441 TaxID=765257 RepID=A0A0C9ZXV9_9AGAM|nr:hypothetical protein PISMIDRAFT_675327 [Pisolithus microcarpus 441]
MRLTPERLYQFHRGNAPSTNRVSYKTKGCVVLHSFREPAVRRGFWCQYELVI